PALSARCTGTEVFRLTHLGFVASNQLAVLGDTRDPVGDLGHIERAEKLSGDAVEHERQAALVHVNQNLAHLATNLAVHQQDFIGGVEVPHIVGNFLEVPAQFSGVGIQRDHAGGVQVYVLGFVGAGNN